MSNILFSLFIVFGVYFLYASIRASEKLIQADYFAVLEDPSFHEHIKYFFWAKFACLLYLSLSPKQDNFLKMSFLLLVFSVGFLLIGLRGYFISYLFLYLYFYNERNSLGLIRTIFGALLILFGASYVLEYRLGFSIFENYTDMLTKPLYQQGATFEVVFGAVNFHHDISQCISIVEFFIGPQTFGGCVDSTRGIQWKQGGFASSFIAEAYFFGPILFAVLSLFLGAGVKLCDELSAIRTNQSFKSISYPKAFGCGFILFLVIPNLVYFGRSSVFDFLIKLITIIFLYLWKYFIHLKTFIISKQFNSCFCFAEIIC
jgi:hypothetical protein